MFNAVLCSTTVQIVSAMCQRFMNLNNICISRILFNPGNFFVINTEEISSLLLKKTEFFYVTVYKNQLHYPNQTLKNLFSILLRKLQDKQIYVSKPFRVSTGNTLVPVIKILLSLHGKWSCNNFTLKNHRIYHVQCCFIQHYVLNYVKQANLIFWQLKGIIR